MTNSALALDVVGRLNQRVVELEALVDKLYAILAYVDHDSGCFSEDGAACNCGHDEAVLKVMEAHEALFASPAAGGETNT